MLMLCLLQLVSYAYCLLGVSVAIDACAQSYPIGALPMKIGYQLPAMIRTVSINQGSSPDCDTTAPDMWYQSYEIPLTLSNLTRSGDTLRADHYEVAGAAHIQATLQVVLDTETHILRSLESSYTMEYDFRGDFEARGSFIHMSSIPYTIDSTGAVSVAVASSDFSSSIDSISGYSSTHIGSSNLNKYSSNELRSLLDDTSRYSFSLRMAAAASSSSVAISRGVTPGLSIRLVLGTSEREYMTHFASSDSPRTLELVDALGRPVMRVPIPLGDTEVKLSVVSLPPGLYFARLGELTTSFLVP